MRLCIASHPSSPHYPWKTPVPSSLPPHEVGEGDGWIHPEPPLQAEEAQLSLNAHINAMPSKKTQRTHLVLSEEEALPHTNYSTFGTTFLE